MPRLIPVAGNLQFAQRVFDRLVFAGELEAELLGPAVDGSHSFELPHLRGGTRQYPLDLPAHANDMPRVERVNALEEFFFKVLRLVRLPANQHRLPLMPLVQDRPVLAERAVVRREELQMTVPGQAFSLSDDARLLEGRRELPVPFAMRLEVFEVLHRGQQKA